MRRPHSPVASIYLMTFGQVASKGRVFDAVAGALESSEFLRQSRTVAEQWGKAGAQTRYEAIAATNHFTVLDALADPQSAMVARVTELASGPEMTKAALQRGG